MASQDELIKSTIVDQFYLDSRVDASRVNVEVEDGIVTLHGEVSTYHSARAASRDALQAGGVRGIRNMIVVRYPSGLALPTDAALLSAALERLERNPDMDIDGLDIEVDAGRIVLRGSVDAYWKKQYAEELLAGEQGVLAIDNHLAVVPGRDIVDHDIAAAIVTSWKDGRWSRLLTWKCGLKEAGSD